MTRRAARLALALGTAALAASCGSSAGDAASQARDARTSAHSAATSRAASTAAHLSLAQLAGQRVIYAYSGPRPPRSLLLRIRRGEAAGVILFGDNVGTRRELGNAVAELQRESLASPVPERLLISTDQEGGQVRRIPGEPALSEKQIGESSERMARATAAGRGAGLNLRGVGVNVNLAPVLDVYRQPGNFIDQYERSYSRNAGTVAALGGAFIRAQQATGVAATAKHFPGLGAAGRGQNTDERPVTIHLSRSTLSSVDEAPYRTAIADGVRLVMVSWAKYPAFGTTYPAGLSAKIIEGELRGHLHFQGVTITDSLSAGALTRYGGIGRRAVLAAEAGADLVLCASGTPAAASPDVGVTALRAIEAAAVDGRVTRRRLETSAARVIALREHP